MIMFLGVGNEEGQEVRHLNMDGVEILLRGRNMYICLDIES